jgi:prepilin-type N-terminal cleavage/methylation domain-containing protein
MKLSRIIRIFKRQSGFTLVELLVALAITGLLAGGIATAILQVTTINSSNSSRMTAVKQIEYAIDTIRQDIIAAQKTPDSGNSTYTLSRVSWSDKTEYSITYRLVDDNLVREESINHGIATSRVVAQNIDEISWVKDPSGKVIFTISATVNSVRSATETRTFDIYPRPAY